VTGLLDQGFPDINT